MLGVYGTQRTRENGLRQKHELKAIFTRPAIPISAVATILQVLNELLFGNGAATGCKLA